MLGRVGGPMLGRVGGPVMRGRRNRGSMLGLVVIVLVVTMIYCIIILIVLAWSVLRAMVGRVRSIVVRWSVRVLSVRVLAWVGPLPGVREPRVGRQEVRLLYFFLSLLLVISASDRGSRPLERNILVILLDLNILELCMDQQHGQRKHKEQ